MRTSQDEWRELNESPNEEPNPNAAGDCRPTPRRSWPMLLALGVGVGLAVTAFVFWVGDESLRRSITLGLWGALTCVGGMTAASQSRCGGCCLFKRKRQSGALENEAMTEHHA